MSTPAEHRLRRGDGGLFGPRAFLWLLAALLLGVASLFAARQGLPASDPYGSGQRFLSQEWWMQPVEIASWRRVPLINSFRFNQLAFAANGRHGWAVGDIGIAWTQDGGKTWTKATGDAGLGFRSTVIQGDGQQGWAVGFGGIAWTHDGGKTWTKANADTGLRFRRAVMQGDGQQGWAVGDDGIAWTQDGGKTWTKATGDADIGSNVSTVMQADGQQGWAAGLLGVAWTQDGGKTWTKATGDTDLGFGSMVMRGDGQQGWGVGYSGIAWTQDSGRTWTMATGDADRGFQTTVMRGDGRRGWAVGDKGIVWTQDGGKTWTKATGDTDLGFGSTVMRGDGPQGWAAGGGGIAWTQDGGKTWTKTTGDAGLGLNSPVMQGDGQRGWTLGGDYIAWTQNGGKTWTKATGNTVLGFRSTVMQGDGKQGWAVGNGGIAWTQDSGKTWTKATGDTDLGFRSTVMQGDGQQGWAVSDDGIAWTQDGGKTWTKATGDTDLGFGSTVMRGDGQQGWAVGSRGIAWTQDSGKAWTKAAGDADRVFNGTVMQGDGKRGWAVGGDYIAWTQDSGKTWMKATGGAGLGLDSIVMQGSGEQGWAVGNGGIAWTQDGGKTWTKPSGDTGYGFRSTVMQGDGKQGWAVGNGGIAWTQDSGKTWTKATGDTDLGFRSTVMQGDGQQGWAVSDDGIAWTQDGGKTWTKATGDTDLGFGSTVMRGDGQQGWAVGSRGIAWTQDSGKAWTKVGGERAADFLSARPEKGLPRISSDYKEVVLFDPAAEKDGALIADNGRYRRYPAPWFYVAALFCIGLALFATFGLDPPTILPPGSVEDALASEMPVDRFEDDKLGYARIAEGLARFMTNPRTEPPQAIAISGPWGQGKSSILWLLRTRLREWGFSTVSFNAWHHQKNEQVLASLFAHLREQGIPPIASVAGLQFRLRLIGLRIAKRPVWWSLIASGSLFAIGWAVADPGSFREMVDGVAKSFSQLLPGNNESGVWPFIEPVGVLGVISVLGFAVWKLVPVFGLKPQDLIRRTREELSLRSLGSPEAARYRFAQDFRAFTEAQGIRPTTIFIDDLDRCEPKIVLEVLEVVNFLVSSGHCFVVMSLEKRWIKAAIEQEYESLAKRVDAKEPLAEFSARYLEKLINIEIPVPRSRETLRLMLRKREQTAAAVGKWWQRTGRQLARLHPAVTVLAVLLVSGGAGYWQGLPPPMDDSATPAAVVETKLPEVEERKRQFAERCKTAKGEATQASSPGEACPDMQAEQQDATEGTPEEWFVPGQPNSVAYVDWAYPLVALIVLVLVGFVAMARRSKFQTEDSENFLKALELWADWLVDELQTPRAFKRFTNKVRFLAMIARKDLQAARPDGVLRRVWLTLRRGRGALLEQERRLDLVSPGVVALAAILELQPNWNSKVLKDWLGGQRDKAGRRILLTLAGQPDSDASGALVARLNEMVERHLELFQLSPSDRASWIPEDELCALIEDVIAVR